MDYVFQKLELGRRELTPEWNVEWSCEDVPSSKLYIRKMAIVAYAELCGTHGVHSHPLATNSKCRDRRWRGDGAGHDHRDADRGTADISGGVSKAARWKSGPRSRCENSNCVIGETRGEWALVFV